MNKTRFAFAFMAMTAVSGFAQSGLWRTSADVQEGTRGTIVGTVADVLTGSSRIVLTPDNDNYDQVTIDTDSVSTQYNGFGGTINGSPEIYVGSTGFSNVRTGDRLEVRGAGSGNALLRADRITLLGRSLASPQTGVGQTRSPGSISSPTARGTTSATSPDRLGRVEGTIRQVNADEGRIVIETDRREIRTVRATSSTPVYYKGDTYRLNNLEVGDRIRIEPESGSTGTTGSEIRARLIDVMSSVQDSAGNPNRQVGALSGRVTRVDRTSDVVMVDTGRGEVRVDLAGASDSSGRAVRGRDLQVGDRVSLSGTYNGDLFVASTVGFGDTNPSPGTSTPNNRQRTDSNMTVTDLGVVTIYGTVVQALDNSPQLILRDSHNGNRSVRIYLLEDFAYRTKAGSYSTADHLKANDSVVVKAYRDGDGNYIAQTIRAR